MFTLILSVLASLPLHWLVLASTKFDKDISESFLPVSIASSVISENVLFLHQSCQNNRYPGDVVMILCYGYVSTIQYCIYNGIQTV